MDRPTLQAIRAAQRDDTWRTPPEVIATEQRILITADALLTWMKRTPITDETRVLHDKINGFFVHEAGNPFAEDTNDLDNVKVTKLILDLMDRDTNRLFMDLLRACWERRCWQNFHGMRYDPQID